MVVSTVIQVPGISWDEFVTDLLGRLRRGDIRLEDISPFTLYLVDLTLKSRGEIHASG